MLASTSPKHMAGVTVVAVAVDVVGKVGDGVVGTVGLLMKNVTVPLVSATLTSTD